MPGLRTILGEQRRLWRDPLADFGTLALGAGGAGDDRCTPYFREHPFRDCARMEPPLDPGACEELVVACGNAALCTAPGHPYGWCSESLIAAGGGGGGGGGDSVSATPVSPAFAPGLPTIPGWPSWALPAIGLVVLVMLLRPRSS